MTLSTLLAVLTVVLAVPLNVYVTVKLWRLARSRPDVVVLRDRALVATSLVFIVSVFALVFVNNELEVPPLDNEATRLVTRLAILVGSIIPALYWIRLYRSEDES